MQYLGGMLFMKALVFKGVKSFVLEKRPIPELKDGCVLIKVRYTGICGSDVRGYLGESKLRLPETIMGHEISGVVEDPGDSMWAKGDKVAIWPILPCGKCEYCLGGYPNLCDNNRGLIGETHPGSLAEYLIVPASNLVALPKEADLKRAAIAEPLAVAVHAVCCAGGIAGRRVGIIGAGPIGLLVLQLVLLKKPDEVLVVDIDSARLVYADKLGATIVCNPKEGEINDIVLDKTEGKGFDLSFDVAGSSEAFDTTLHILRRKGRLISIAGWNKDSHLDLNYLVTREITVSGSYNYTKKEYEEAINLILQEKIRVEELISGIYTLAKAKEAFDILSQKPSPVLKLLIES